MPTPTPFTLRFLLGGALLLVLIALIRYVIRRTSTGNRSMVKQRTVTRSVVYLVSGSHLLVMQHARKGRLRARLEVPKGKVMKGESALDAAYRECLEESGLRPLDLQLLTSFQTPQRTGKHRGMETWDAFWGSVPVGKPMPFTHRVMGQGRDRGRVYHFRLVPLDAARLHPPLDVPLAALRRALAEADHDDMAPGVQSGTR